MIINFNKVILDGFMSFNHAELVIDDLGIVNIVGENQYEPLSKSNGSGKSAIVESILWCLTASTSRGSSNVMNTILNKGTYVTVDLDVDDKNYVITRAKSHCDYGNMLRIIRDGEDISGNTVTKSKEILSQEFQGKLDYDTLTSIIILSQGLPGRLSVLKPSSRKARLEELSNTDNYLEQLSNRVNGYHSELNSEVSRLQIKLQDKLSESKTLEFQISNAKSKIEEITKSATSVTEGEYNQAKKDLEEVEELLNVLHSKSAERSKLLSNYNSTISNCNSEIARLKKNAQDLINLIETLGTSICPTCNRPMDDQSKIDELKGKYTAELSEVKSSIKSRLESMQEAKDKIPELQEKLDAASSVEKDYLWTKSKNRDIISEYEKSSGSIEAYESSIVDLEKKLEESKKDIPSMEKELKDVQTKVEITSYLKNQISRKFRSFLLEGILSYMNLKCQEYSPYLFSTQGTVKLEINGNNIDILLGDRKFEDLSGGEGRRVDILLQLVQRDLAKNESGFSSNILVLDEVLDNLDNIGSESVIGLLEYKSPDISSMFIVSHKTDLNLPYDKRIKVIKDSNQISRIANME